MQDIEKFVAWIKTKGGQRGLAATISKKFPKDPLSQTAISNWVTRRLVPLERRVQLEAIGWNGPWEWPEEAQEAAAPTGGPYVTEKEFSELVGRVKTLKDDLEAEKRKVFALQGVARQLAKVAGLHLLLEQIE